MTRSSGGWAAPAEPRGRHATRRAALLVLLAWTLYGCVYYSQYLLFLKRQDYHPGPLGPLLMTFGNAWAWAALTPAIVWLVRRFPLPAGGVRAVLVHLPALLAAQAVMTAIQVAALDLMHAHPRPTFVRLYPAGIAETLVFYAATLAATLALDHARLARARELRAARLQADLSQAQLRSLKSQLQPHFLFNTLNTISELLYADPEAADDMVARLGGLLRASLEEHDRLETTLERELRILELYTVIEQVRFRGWLRVESDVAEEARDALVPSMLLQPLVENAIRHGIAPRKGPGTIRVAAARRDGSLVLEVCDDGVGLSGEPSALPVGVGLGTTRARLEQLYGPAARLRIDGREGGGTRVTVTLPFRAADPPRGDQTALAARAFVGTS